MKKELIGFTLCLVLTSGILWGESEKDRLASCAKVMEEIVNIPDGIPRDLLDKAECVVVLPSVVKFALGIGGSYGKGALMCRSGKNFNGPWGVPAMYRLEGGTIGLQLGGTATDYVLLIMNPRGIEGVLSSKVKLGADATAAAGPKGRSTSAETDASMRAEILSYSRARGLFAGVSLAGSTLRQDADANKTVFGKKISAKEIIFGENIAVPKEAKELVSVMQKASPKNLSNK